MIDSAAACARGRGISHLGGDRGAGASGLDGRGQRRDVVRPVVAATVDEERRRTGNAALIGGLDVLADTRRALALAQVVAKTLDVEPDLLRMGHEVAHGER